MTKIKIWFISKRKVFLWVFILLTIFSISVSVRYKNFNVPMVRHHEWLTAHSLVIMKVWEQRGIAYSYFAPAYTFKNEGDKWDNSICALNDKEGNSFYVSYGPFAQLLPYMCFKLFRMPINQNSLVFFNLVVHFFTGLFLYLIILRMSKKCFADFSLAALAAFTMYTFSPGTLWFHGNIYFNEILAQLIFAAGLYVFYLIIEQKAKVRKTRIWYFIICFIGVYNEWLGLFFVFFTGTVFLILAYKNRCYLKLFLLATLMGISSLALIVFQYSQIAGFKRLIEVSLQKFTDRNGGTLSSTITEQQHAITSNESFKKIEQFFNANFINVVNTFAFVAPLFLILVFWRKNFFLTSIQGILAIIAILCVLAHHFVFYNFTAIHDFGILKTGLVLVLLVSIMIISLEKFVQFNRWVRYSFILITLFFLTVKAIEASSRYLKTDPISSIHHHFKNAGDAVKKYIKFDEKAFANIGVCPTVDYYAERNVAFDENGNRAKLWSKEWKQKSAFVKLINDQCVSITRYYPNGDTLYYKIQSGK